uniref:EF-hand domain-containing protein n=1 Tax=Rhodnius prolixus TaxID=13249 RepID=T1HKB6_RHOPR
MEDSSGSKKPESCGSYDQKLEDTEIYEEMCEEELLDLNEACDFCHDEKQINPKLLKLLAPDGSEYITMESLKNIVSKALGERFTDEEIDSALSDLGVPHNEPIHYRVFLDLITMPSPSALRQIKVDYGNGESLTVEEWQEAMARIGVDISKEEIENILLRAKSVVDNVSAEYKPRSPKDADNAISSHGDLTKRNLQTFFN